MAVDLTKNAPMSAVKKLGDKVKALDTKVNDLVTSGGEPNKINSISVNGTVLTPDSDKKVEISVPTKTSELTNDSNYQTDTEVQAAIAAKLGSVYTPKGTVAFADLPALAAENVGNVYNISNAFVTTADFVEGAGVSHGAGVNVAIVEVSEGVYKYDALAGSVDLTNYYTKSEIDAMTATEQDVDDLLAEIFPTT